MAKLWLALVKVNEGARSQVVPLLSATVSSRLVAGLAEFSWTCFYRIYYWEK
jgi:hypothetical protein